MAGSNVRPVRVSARVAACRRTACGASAPGAPPAENGRCRLARAASPRRRAAGGPGVATELLLPGEVDGLVLGAVVPVDAFPPAEDGAAAGGPLAPEAWELAGPLALSAGSGSDALPPISSAPWTRAKDLGRVPLVGCVLIGCALAGAGRVAVGCGLVVRTTAVLRTVGRGVHGSRRRRRGVRRRRQPAHVTPCPPSPGPGASRWPPCWHGSSQRGRARVATPAGACLPEALGPSSRPMALRWARAS